MIERYQVKSISAIWEDQRKFTYYHQVELALLSALTEKGLIPTIDLKPFISVKIDPVRISEIEKETKHDLIAFCQSITEQLPPNISRYYHFGVTSSDIIDTAHSLIIS